MRLLYVSHLERDPLKGAPWADISLMDALRRRGHEIEEIWDFGAPRRINHGNLHLLLEAPRRCERAVLRNCAVRPYDVVLINQPLGWRAGSRIKRVSPAPLYIARSHGWEPRVSEELDSQNAGRTDSRGAIRRTMSRVLRPRLEAQNDKVLEVADGVVVGSVEDRHWIAERSGYPATRILHMPPGIAEDYLSSPAPFNDGQRLQHLLYVGQFAPFKAPEVVAEVMTRVLSVVPETSATWVCSARHHEAVLALFPGALHSRLHLLDWMPRHELIRIYDRSGIYLFPSLSEGFGQTFLEAMARGVVVLASAVGGMREAIRNGENGFLFVRGATREIADRAFLLMSQPAEAAEIGRRARATAEEYTWKSSAEKFERFVSALRDCSGRNALADARIQE